MSVYTPISCLWLQLGACESPSLQLARSLCLSVSLPLRYLGGPLASAAGPPFHGPCLPPRHLPSRDGGPLRPPWRLVLGSGSLESLMPHLWVPCQHPQLPPSLLRSQGCALRPPVPHMDAAFLSRHFHICYPIYCSSGLRDQLLLRAEAPSGAELEKDLRHRTLGVFPESQRKSCLPSGPAGGGGEWVAEGRVAWGVD